MRHKRVAAALANLRRVLADPKLELAQREILRKAERELVKYMRSGKEDNERLRRVLEYVAEALYESVQATSQHPQSDCEERWAG